MSELDWFRVVGGLILLLGGAELLVRGSSRIAAVLGIPPVIIGLTVVAFGTSAPELAVSLSGALHGNGGNDISLGNVVGSNIVNILLILGLSAAITPLAVTRRLIRTDVPIMVGLSLLIWVLGLNQHLDTWEGWLLVILLAAYLASCFLRERHEKPVADGAAVPPPRQGILLNIVLTIAGLGLLIVGADLLVNGATSVARALGISELIIGLTVVAGGTSLPELATSALAAVRGERDIAVGNIVGSNIFNILAVLGFSAAIAPGGLAISPAALGVDLPVMIAAAVACLPIFFSDYRISRPEGILFLFYYLLYILYLFLASTHHDALPVFNTILWFVVVPLTLLALATSLIRSLMFHHREGHHR
ncbi:MAG: calcium/sodium antiporter [Acidobacteria bacterium]|nr:calcium/sodium antiporter [Acidobacteriota bacterium]